MQDAAALLYDEEEVYPAFNSKPNSSNKQNSSADDHLLFRGFPFDSGKSEEWLLNEYDIEAICVGSGILGCGGGGSSYLARIRAKEFLKAGKSLRIVKASRFGVDPSQC